MRRRRRYHESKLVLVAQPGTDGHVDGYVEECLENVKELANSGNYSFGLDGDKEACSASYRKSIVSAG